MLALVRSQYGSTLESTTWFHFFLMREWKKKKKKLFASKWTYSFETSETFLRTTCASIRNCSACTRTWSICVGVLLLLLLLCAIIALLYAAFALLMQQRFACAVLSIYWSWKRNFFFGISLEKLKKKIGN